MSNIHDWDKVNFDLITQAKDGKNSFQDGYYLLLTFAEQVEELYRKQLSRIPALERK